MFVCCCLRELSAWSSLVVVMATTALAQNPAASVNVNANATYNWQDNSANRGGDWYFETLGDGDGYPGISADQFVSTAQGGGAEPMLTIPLVATTAGRRRRVGGSIPAGGLESGGQGECDCHRGYSGSSRCRARAKRSGCPQMKTSN